MGKIKENSFQKNESRVQFELPYILTRQTTQRTSAQFELIPEIFTQKKNCGKIKSAKIQKKTLEKVLDRKLRKSSNFVSEWHPSLSESEIKIEIEHILIQRERPRPGRG